MDNWIALFNSVGGLESNYLDDPTTKSDYLIPYVKSVNSIALGDCNVLSAKTMSIEHLKSPAHTILGIVIKFKINEQTAKRIGDSMKYTALPALKLINKITVIVTPNTTFEVINTQVLYYRLRDYYTSSRFDSGYWYELCEKWFGGINSFNQEFTTCGNFTPTPNNINRNVIKPEIECTVPIPASLLMSDEKFRYPS